MGAFLTGWSEAETDRLKALAAQGYSAGQISQCLPGRSRNAVLGRLDRLGVPLLTAVGHHVGRRVQRRPRIPAAPKPVPEPPPAPTPPQMVKLDQLSRSTCRWPIGDPLEESFAFCGNPVKTPHPYCPDHCHIAFAPQRPREDREPVGRVANGRRYPARRGQTSLWE